MEQGWDLNLRAQVEEGVSGQQRLVVGREREGGFFGTNYRRQNSRNNFGDMIRKDNGQLFNPILVFNLEGISKNKKLPNERVSCGLVVLMEKELEENPFQTNEGQKRTRPNYFNSKGSCSRLISIGVGKDE